MCGILIYREDKKPLFNIDHRGIITNKIEKDGWVFGHRLLPLQTQGLSGLQPIPLGYDRYLLFNGEIFNYYKFGDYNSDTSYLTFFFREKDWRTRINEINKWCGFWSIVIYEEEGFTAFTDPLGKKQLYYREDSICSEIKPLIGGSILNKMGERIDNNSNSIFHNIKRVRPNRIYRLKPHPKTRKLDVYINGLWYYKMKQDPVKTEIKGLLQESVQDRLINKRDGITIFLSGGLDSTILLYHLLESGYKSDLIELLSIENGEEEFLVEIEDFYNIKIRRIRIVESYYEKAIFAYENFMDYGSLLPQYLLFKESKNTVVLTGDGADELFGGYNRAQLGDTQKYDMRTELPYYHHIRLDRCSMIHTKEARNPFLSRKIISLALQLEYRKRRGKSLLLKQYSDAIPRSIIERKKKPLRNGDKNRCQKKARETFKSIFKELGEDIPPQTKGIQ